MHECELVDARNVSGTATVGGAEPFDIPGCVVTVPASPWPVWLEYGARVERTEPGSASAILSVVDVTDASAARVVTSATEALPPFDGQAEPAVLDLHAVFRIGPAGSKLRLKLQVTCVPWSGEAAFAVSNTATNPSYLTALQR